MGPGQVYMMGTSVTISGAVYDATMISALSKSGHCYYVVAMWSGNAPTIGYAISSGGCASSWTYSTNPLPGSAASHNVLSATAFSAAGGSAPFYQSW